MRLFSTLTAAVLLLAAVVLLMLTGVVPTASGHQSVVFRSPVFAALLLGLCISLLACSLRRFRRRPASVGFLLVHVSPVVILGGAFLTFVAEKSCHVQFPVDSRDFLREAEMADGTRVPLGFAMRLAAFEVERYRPVLRLYASQRDEDPAEALVGLEGEVTFQRPERTVRVLESWARAEITDAPLSGPPVLEIDGPGGVVRVELTGPMPKEVPLADGERLTVLGVYNNLPRMEPDEQYRETVYPVRPGIVFRHTRSSRSALYSLESGGQPRLLSAASEAGAPRLPLVRYSVPPVEKLVLRERESGPPRSAIRLALPGREAPVTLAEAAPGHQSVVLEDGSILQLAPPPDKWYEATLEIRSDNGEPQSRILAVNHPVVENGWRIYLTSYDRRQNEYVVLFLRRDPGRPWVVGGIFTLLVGLPLMLYTPGRLRPCDGGAAV